MLTLREYDILMDAHRHDARLVSVASASEPAPAELICLFRDGYLIHKPVWKLINGKLTFVSRYQITRTGTAAMVEYRQWERQRYERLGVSR